MATTEALTEELQETERELGLLMGYVDRQNKEIEGKAADGEDCERCNHRRPRQASILRRSEEAGLLPTGNFKLKAFVRNLIQRALTGGYRVQREQPKRSRHVLKTHTEHKLTPEVLEFDFEFMKVATDYLLAGQSMAL